MSLQIQIIGLVLVMDIMVQARIMAPGEVADLLNLTHQGLHLVGDHDLKLSKSVNRWSLLTLEVKLLSFRRIIADA